jgi:hypothetical protein
MAIMKAFWGLALLTLTQAQNIELLQNEPIILYADVSPKLRIITKSSAFSGELNLINLI